MACNLNMFVLDGKWEATTLPNGIKVDTAEAHRGTLRGVLYKINGIFHGFVGTKDAAIWWAERARVAVKETV